MRSIRFGSALLVCATLFFASCSSDTPGPSHGLFDPSFSGTSTGPAANPWVTCLAKQSDDKIIIGGYFTTDGGNTVGHVSRRLADGAVDTAFNAGGAGADGNVWALAVQPDDKILVGGNFANFNGVAHRAIVRLNADGSLDQTFASPSAMAGAIETIVIVPNDSAPTNFSILVGGDISLYGSSSHGGIVRLDANGALDAAFDPTGAGTDYDVQRAAVQADGAIVITGGFTTYDGATRNGIARLNSDGTLDSTFNVGAGLDTPNHNTLWPCGLGLAIQSDGKILVGGNFTLYNGVAAGYLTRLNADGSRDATFNPNGAGATAHIRSIVPMSDGHILVSGNFWSYNGVKGGEVGFYRLNANGSLDTDFYPDRGPSGDMFGVVVQSTGRMVIGGWNSALARYLP